MEQTEKYRRTEMLRLIEWIRGNHSAWAGICTAMSDGAELEPGECKEVIRLLRRNGFYQLLMVLAYSGNAHIQNAMASVALAELKQRWNDDELFDKILDGVLDGIGT